MSEYSRKIAGRFTAIKCAIGQSPAVLHVNGKLQTPIMWSSCLTTAIVMCTRMKLILVPFLPQVTQLAGYFEPLIKASVGVASKLRVHQQQMTFLDQTKTMAESALQMLYAAKEGGGNPKVCSIWCSLLLHTLQGHLDSHLPKTARSQMPQ